MMKYTIVGTYNIRFTPAPIVVLVQHPAKLLGPLHQHSDAMKVLRCPRPLVTKGVVVGKLLVSSVECPLGLATDKHRCIHLCLCMLYVCICLCLWCRQWCLCWCFWWCLWLWRLLWSLWWCLWLCRTSCCCRG